MAMKDSALVHPSIRTLIAGSEPREIRLLIQGKRYVEVVGETADGAEAAEMIRGLRPDLVIMEVQMPNCDGFEALASAGQEEPPCVIFLASSAEHAVRAFEVNAVDCLVRPFEGARLGASLARAARSIKHRRADAECGGSGRAGRAASDRIPLRSSGEVILVRLGDIDWIEADGDYVRIRAGSRSHLIRGSLSALEARLDPFQFVRIHRSTIISVDRLHKICPATEGECTVVLRDGTKLRVSRGYQDRIKAFIAGMA
jgi:two-component system LytT family response regulator